MTNNQIMQYNKGIPIKCDCCRRTIAYYRDGKIFIKCRYCKQESATKITRNDRAKA